VTQSTEYPDLKWMPPASWTNANRTSVQLVVIHTTEGSEGSTSAEDGAAYDQRRTDGTSTHFFHDSDSTVQCVRTEDIAHAARHQGNLRGIQHELCGSAYQGSAGWADAVSQGTLRQAARQCARDARKWGIPVRKLTVAQVADGVKGFCGHVEITYAFPQDNGTHTDPGPTFPWSQFLDMVRAELEGDMSLTDDDLLKVRTQVALGIYDALWSAAKGVDVGDPVRVPYSGVGNAIAVNLRAIVGGATEDDIAAAKAEILAALASAGVSLSDAQMAALTKAVVDALVNSVGGAVARLEDKLERAGSALTQ
jgi:hypothetical protein